jgi:hypothetical protein
MPENKIRHEFKVVIEGLELPAELVARINKAVQKAVLDEMVSVGGGDKDVVFTPIMGHMVSQQVAKAMAGDGGSTGGIWVRAAVTS